MRLRRQIFTALSVLGLGLGWIISSVPAANVTVNNVDDLYPIALANGDLVPDGTGFVSVGTFPVADSQISMAMDSPANLSALKAAFVEFGSAKTFGDGGEDGFFSDAYVGSVNAADSFDGNAIFLVAGNGSDLDSSNQLWVFKSGEVFAPDGVDEFSVVIRLDTDFEPSGTELIGDPTDLFVPSQEEVFGGSQMEALVPEPSSVALMSLFGLTILRRRR